MNPQEGINLLAKVLPLMMDVLAIFPIVSIPTTTIRIVEDGIGLEQAIEAFLTNTREGKALWAKVQGFGKELGVGFHLDAGKVTAAHLADTESYYDWSPIWGWVPKVHGA